MAFTRWISWPLGRTVRLVAGLVLIGPVSTSRCLGLGDQGRGAIPVFAGVFNFCLLGPILGAPFNGRRIAAQG
jgi:hypothetical protein